MPGPSRIVLRANQLVAGTKLAISPLACTSSTMTDMTSTVGNIIMQILVLISFRPSTFFTSWFNRRREWWEGMLIFSGLRSTGGILSSEENFVWGLYNYSRRYGTELLPLAPRMGSPNRTASSFLPLPHGGRNLRMFTPRSLLTSSKSIGAALTSSLNLKHSCMP